MVMDQNDHQVTKLVTGGTEKGNELSEGLAAEKAGNFNTKESNTTNFTYYKKTYYKMVYS